MALNEKLLKSREYTSYKRILLFLKNGNTKLSTNKKNNQSILKNIQGNCITVAPDVLLTMISSGLIIKDNNQICIHKNGTAFLRRLLSQVEPYREQHTSVSYHRKKVDGKTVSLLINDDESPLSRLFKRKTKNGTSYLRKEEFLAGERLRKDFELTQMSPRLSINWEQNIKVKQSMSLNPVENISIAAINAQERFEKALDDVSPELIGVVIDICCFLKGIEQVERERQWPPRSAKLMLKAGLSSLSRHYGFTKKQSCISKTSIRSWRNLDCQSK